MEQKYQPEKELTPPASRKLSDDVFIQSNVRTTSENENQSNDKQDLSNMPRQRSRNWADCPIDESAVEPSSNIPTDDNTDSFQVRKFYLLFFVKKKNNAIDFVV